MEHLSWLLLHALAWWRLASYSPIQHGETFTLTLSSSIHDHRGSKASTMRSSRYCTSLACTSFLIFFIMLMPWRCTRDITPSYSSIHTCHRFNSHMTNLWITLWTPWSPLDPLHVLLLQTLKPTYGSTIAYGQFLQVQLDTSISP